MFNTGYINPKLIKLCNYICWMSTSAMGNLINCFNQPAMAAAADIDRSRPVAEVIGEMLREFGDTFEQDAQASRQQLPPFLRQLYRAVNDLCSNRMDTVFYLCTVLLLEYQMLDTAHDNGQLRRLVERVLSNTVPRKSCSNDTRCPRNC